MSNLEEIQKKLASSLIDPEGYATEKPAELEGFDSNQILRSAETLVRKRRAQTRELLPRTAKSLGTSYRKLFSEFERGVHFNGFQSPMKDAIAFSDWIGSRKDVEPWLRELARWESLRWRVRIRKWSMATAFLKYEINFASDPSGQTPNKRPSLWITWRANKRSGIFRIGVPKVLAPLVWLI